MLPHADEPLFPLPLSTFEKYMLADDRLDYPMTFFVAIRLVGPFRREVFQQAMAQALRRHPLLAAVVDTAAPGGPCWRAAPPTEPQLDWGEIGTPLQCADGQQIDIRRAPGLRTWVRLDKDAAEVTFQVHHACCDGVGMFQFIGDLLALYGQQTASAGRQPVLPPLDPLRLRLRGRFSPPEVAPVGPVRAAWNIAREAAKWLGRSPTPLSLPARARDDRPPLLAGDFPGIRTHVFARDQFQRLRAAAQQHGVGVNDLLLRDLLLAIVAWNAAQGGRPGRWLRINMPTNLREHHHNRMPAGNAMSQAFVTRATSQCDDPQELLERVHWETEQIKRGRLGLYFLAAMGTAQRVPGLMPLGVALAGRRCHATAVLTNMGEVSRRFTARFPQCDGRLAVGPLVLERLIGVPPIRPKTYAGLAAIIYNGELTLALRMAPQAFSPDDSREFLRTYVSQLERTSAATACRDAGR